MQSMTYKCINVVVLFFALWGNLYGKATYKVRLSSSWYPAHRFELADALSKHQNNAFERYYAHLQTEGMRAIVVPHAGYTYSGDVAAAAYRLINPDYFKRIIIIGPSHHESFHGAGLPRKDYEYYKTVHGYLTLDRDVLNKLQYHDLFSYQGHAHEAEHSINVQLPFIQKFCGSKCQLVPLLIGHVTIDQLKQIATTIKEEIDEHTLVIISSDFTHYGERFGYTPFTKNVTQKIFELDTKLIQKVQNHDLRGFDEILQKTGSTVCGAGPVKILLSLIEQQAFGPVASHVVAYDASASAQKDPDHSVSYVSLVVSKERVEDLPYKHRLTGYEKGLLLKLARQQLQDAVLGRTRNEYTVSGLLTNALQSRQGAFVTLHKIDKDGNRHLRGCIGKMSEDQSLYKAVHSMAKSAALHDSRFTPVTKSELPSLEISISALTTQRSIDSYHDINLGEDGVVLQHGYSSAVYLPTVATDQGWSLEQMLASLSKKAGLDKDVWKSPKTEFKVFQSIDFSENIDPLSIMYERYKK